MNTKVTVYYRSDDGTVDRITMEAIDYNAALATRDGPKYSLEPPPIGTVITAPVLEAGVRVGTCIVRDAEGNTFRPGARRVWGSAPNPLAEQARAKAVEAARDKGDGVVVPLAPTKH